jgi:hypothetical protein
MAVQIHSQTVKISDVFHHPEFNVARLSGDYGSEKELAKLQGLLTVEGWRQNGDGVLEVVAITDDWKARAVAELTAQWEDLKEKVKTDSKVGPFLHVFEINHVKNGKIITPKYMGVSGNRRNKVLAAANVARYEANGDDAIITQYPVLIRDFANEMERYIAQMLENMGKLEGFDKPSEKDMLLCAQQILAKGGIQDDIRRAFTPTTGQKVFWILTLNQRFPEVKLLDRIINTDPKHPSFIRYGPIKGAKLPNLGVRSDPVALAKKNLTERTAGQPETQALTQDGLEEFLGTKTVNAPKIMERKNIEALSQNNPCNVGKAFAKAVVDNNTDIINKYIAHAGVYNAVETLCDKGIGPDLEQILLSLTKAQDLTVAVKSVRSALKV